MSADAETITNAPPPFDDPDADIVVRTLENEMFDVPQPVATNAETQQENVTQDGIPIIFLYDNQNQVCGKDVVDFLLSCCHPARLLSSKPVVPAGLLVSIIDAATRYRIDWAVNTALVDPHFLNTSPLLVFAHACHQGREAEAALAAKETLRFRLDQVPSDPALKLISGYQYHTLLAFHRRCAIAVETIALAENLTTWITAPTLSWFPASHHPCSSHGNLLVNSWNAKLGLPTWNFYYNNQILGHSTQQWWIKYMESTAAALVSRPHSSTVRDRARMDDSYVQASSCPDCLRRMGSFMGKFVPLFEQKIEEVIHQVSAFLICFANLGDK
ncbi:hypothetical protein MSAN_00680100 [Mycena sanguinolenta]|uniref:Uncharacterized protein n=1 Tax=Mycena sanguinolenta TaxID=230812 RepID=A0A8H7DFN6_9AGAR|nr:hypothetical protein MSAN_00680100 [Mycena sanguinolenta]